jgi:hypothetical protein
MRFPQQHEGTERFSGVDDVGATARRYDDWCRGRHTQVRLRPAASRVNLKDRSDPGVPVDRTPFTPARAGRALVGSIEAEED